MMFTLAAATVGFVGSAAYYSPYAGRLVAIRAVRKQVLKSRTLVLTYDDGPSALTPAILSRLKYHKAKATFFMLGRNATQNGWIADRLLEEGHDVGCHSDQHLNAWKVDPWSAVADIDIGYDKLSPWVARNGIYRPPFGKLTLPAYLAVRRRGAAIGWWTIDSGDTRISLPRPNQVADRLVSEGGGVILLHDSDRSKDRNEFVLETTDILLEVAKRESFKISVLSELIN